MGGGRLGLLLGGCRVRGVVALRVVVVVVVVVVSKRRMFLRLWIVLLLVSEKVMLLESLERWPWRLPLREVRL